jgi:hypothetical protein
MPTDDIAAARAWIQARARQRVKESAASSLSDQRKRKLELECQLLALRVEREADNSEFLPVNEVLAAVSTFLRFSHITLRQRAEQQAENLAATQTPLEALRIVMEIVDSTWLKSVLEMARQVAPGRMSRAIAELASERFPLLPEEEFVEASAPFDKKQRSVRTTKKSVQQKRPPAKKATVTKPTTKRRFTMSVPGSRPLEELAEDVQLDRAVAFAAKGEK